MKLRSVLKKAAPQSIVEYLNDIQIRLSRLEKLERRLTAYQATIMMLENTIDTMIDSPLYYADAAVGFNSQIARKEIFTDIIGAFDFKTIVETGTWTGNTTGYMAQTARVRVFSAEVSHRFHSIARMRLTEVPGITMRNADSRSLLKELAKDGDVTGGWTFFYLDAHWYDDLPLAEEIDLIAGFWKNFVILVDDFQVPGDDGYGFDDYGNGKALTLDYIASGLKKHDLTAWYPSTRSSEETGAKRGCVVVTRSGAASQKLAGLASLARA